MLAIIMAAAIAAPASAEAALKEAVLNAQRPAAGLRLPPAEAEAYALRSAGIARTSIERRSDKATASMGFLCGLPEGARRSGDPYGSDPHVRFVGAKLSFAFR